MRQLQVFASALIHVLSLEKELHIWIVNRNDPFEMKWIKVAGIHQVEFDEGVRKRSIQFRGESVDLPLAIHVNRRCHEPQFSNIIEFSPIQSMG